MSPQEYYEIRRTYVAFHIKNLNCTVTSLGTRAPYSTNTSNIEVANSNLPLMDYYGINEHYRTIIEENVSDIIKKIRGDVLVKGGGDTFKTTDFSPTFPNISSRLETRRWPKRLIICQRVPLIKDGDSAKTLDSGYVHANPNLMYHCSKMINASNHLGVSFAHSYDANTIFYKRQDQAGCEYGDIVHVEGETYNFTETPTYGKNNNTPRTFPLKMGPIIGDYALASIVGDNSYNSVRKIPTFAFGHYLLRNITTDLATDVSTEAYNSIVDLNHEFLLDCAMTCTITVNIPIYYNPSYAPDSFWHGETARGNYVSASGVGADSKEMNNGLVIYMGTVQPSSTQGATQSQDAYTTETEEATTAKKKSSGMGSNSHQTNKAANREEEEIKDKEQLRQFLLQYPNHKDLKCKKDDKINDFCIFCKNKKTSVCRISHKGKIYIFSPVSTWLNVRHKHNV